MGGKKAEGQKGPPTNAKDQDEEKFIQYAELHISLSAGCNAWSKAVTLIFECRDFIRSAEQEGEKAGAKH